MPPGRPQPTRVDPVAQEIVHELLGETAHFHIGIHVQVLYQEAVAAEHFADGDHIRVHLAPGEGLYGHIQVICAGAGHFQHGSHRETGARVTVVLYLDVRIFLFDIGHQLSQHIGTADTGHVLKANFIGAVFHHLVHNIHVIGDGVYGGIGDGQGHLRNHAAFFGANHGAFEVAVVVEAAEGTGDVRSLLFLDLEHEFTHIQRNRIHAQGVETALQHVGLDAGLVERRGPGAHGLVGVFAKEEVHLLKSAAVGFHTVKAAHVDDGGRHLYKLIHPGDIFPGTLPHVPVNQGELDFTFCHIVLFVNLRIHKCSNNSWILCL